MPSPTPEVTFKDRSVHEIHLENGYTYVIEQNLKHFASVVAVLAKFSEQILLQPTDDGLVLSASSSARSAYAKVKLCRQFFDRMRARENLAPDGEVFCRLATKSLMHIFKSASQSSAGPVPSCSLELDPHSDFAYVHLQCLSGIRRCFVLSLREHAMVCDNVFNERQRLKNRVTAHAKMLSALLSPLDCSDLELVVLPEQFAACRYIPREEYGKVRRTEVQIPVDHCEQYRIDVPTRVVINLRELRPILQFADICGMSVTLYFDRAGRPLIVSVEENVDFAAEFVLGTLDEQLPINEHHQQQQRQNAQQPPHQPQEQRQTPTVAEREEPHNETPPLTMLSQMPRHPTPTEPTAEQQQPPQLGQMSLRSTPILRAAAPAAERGEQHNTTPPLTLSQDQMLRRPSPAFAASTPAGQGEAQQTVRHTPTAPPTEQQQAEEEQHETPPPSQGQMLRRPSPTLEFVDPKEVPLERYIMNEPFQHLSVVPRPEGMSVWEQESDVGSRVQSSSVVSRTGDGCGAGTTAPRTVKATGWMSKRSASQRGKR